MKRLGFKRQPIVFVRKNICLLSESLFVLHAYFDHIRNTYSSSGTSLEKIKMRALSRVYLALKCWLRAKQGSPMNDGEGLTGL